ncbi:2OG-Fe(II) oxygenase [Thiocapsa bogorovii]|uniref:2OG-Fe(II) oxygenase n=1 Tax=Thiocapsa bogorovii TaxID=521689 RepID=UPI001E64277E|nr:2OG-Fe(II) oxygenase [Thiocapsa bogorovii]UHD14962.1 2OG-Fe(II) oxygenase family protein [Thiocapsa bogorovii]
MKQPTTDAQGAAQRIAFRGSESASGVPSRVGWSNAEIHRCGLADAERVNAAISAAVSGMQADDFERRTHFIGDRFENLYLERTRIPAITSVLDQAVVCAGLILGRAPGSVHCGFWLNLTGPGQSTSKHTHDEHDELLSGVYYVAVPPDSGDLILYDGPSTIRIEPRAGTFIFFPPNLPHAVETNRSALPRLSIGINIGPL